MNLRSDPAVANNSAAQLPESFEPSAPGRGEPLNLDAAILAGLEVSLRVKLGEVTLTIEDLLALKSGAVLALDRKLNEPVELYLNQGLIGRGEIVAVDDCFGVRVTEVGPR